MKLAAAMVTLLAVLATAGAWGNALTLDDGPKIEKNGDLRAEGWDRLVYPYEGHVAQDRNDPSRPLVYALFTMVYRGQGTTADGYHELGTAAHAAAGLVALALLYDLTGNACASSLGAALFVGLPIQTGAAPYAYALSDVLAGLFSLLTVLLYRRGKLRWALATMVLGLTAKQSLVVAPLLVWIGAQPTRIGSAAEQLRRLAPFLVVVLGYFALRLWYFGELGDLEAFGAEIPWFDYVLGQGVVWLRYIGLTFVPVGLCLDHYVTGYPLWMGLGAWCVIVGIGTLAVKHSALGLIRPLAWWAVCLLPTSLLATTDYLVERRCYTATFGLCWLVALGVVRFPRARWVVGGLALGYALYGATLLERHHSKVDGFEAMLEAYPDNPRAANGLGAELMARGEFDRARKVMDRVIEKDPLYHPIMPTLASLYSNDRAPFRNLETAEKHARNAVRLYEGIGSHHFQLGRILQLQGKTDDAAHEYLRALQLDPGHAMAHNNLGVLYLRRGQWQEARDLFREAVRLDPSDPIAHRNMRDLR